MDGINWGGLVQRRNFFDELADGFSKGQEIRLDRQHAAAQAEQQQFQREEILRKRGIEEADMRRKANVGAAVAKGDFAGARTAAEGDFDLIKSVGELDDAQKKAAREKADDLAGFAAVVKLQPYEKRRAIITEATDVLAGYGFTPDKIAAFDPTDAALDAQIARAMDLKTALEEANRQRDDARADKQAKETERHNRAGEATASRNARTAESNSARGWAAHRARERAGGYGTPGVGSSGVVPDDDVEETQ